MCESEKRELPRELKGEELAARLEIHAAMGRKGRVYPLDPAAVEAYPPLLPKAEELNPLLPQTPEEFEALYGVPCWQDDLVRLHCKDAGDLLHMHCGVCPTHKRPATMCACVALARLARPAQEVS